MAMQYTKTYLAVVELALKLREGIYWLRLKNQFREAMNFGSTRHVGNEDMNTPRGNEIEAILIQDLRALKSLGLESGWYGTGIETENVPGVRGKYRSRSSWLKYEQRVYNRTWTTNMVNDNFVDHCFGLFNQCFGTRANAETYLVPAWDLVSMEDVIFKSKIIECFKSEELPTSMVKQEDLSGWLESKAVAEGFQVSEGRACTHTPGLGYHNGCKIQSFLDEKLNACILQGSDGKSESGAQHCEILLSN
ncbi:hypothetical protein K438DRAFT_1787077 [Mycena galopus ATCC 62051]|nr:hypothetical protein K438DRAFT_1787077 [Mycena galopus ATCC 62051]